MILPQFHMTLTGGILFDAGRMAKPDESWFEVTTWQALGKVSDYSSGRGQVAFIDAPFGECVLRHYRRGGMMTWFSEDRYLWTGAERTRGLREFRLLAQLYELGLPVPAPIAARYQYDGLYYRADLITCRINDVITLAECLARSNFDTAVANRVGKCIARFHALGAYHADLNAHNVVLDAEQVWLLDFDRGDQRVPTPTWRYANLTRLQRSLLKLGAREKYGNNFDALWSEVMMSYDYHFDDIVKNFVEHARTLSQRQSSL